MPKGSPERTAVTDKQREAMKQANVDYVYQSIFEVTKGDEIIWQRKILEQHLRYIHAL